MSTNISLPQVILNILQANLLVAENSQRVLIIGQKTAAGTAASGVLIQNLTLDNAVVNGLFGENSMVAGMIRKHRETNEITPIDIIPLDDAGGGTKATGNVDFTGSVPTEAGTILVSVGSERDHTYEIVVTTTDTATTLGDKLVAAIAADSKAPFSGSNAAGDVEITYVHNGTVGNTTGLRIQGTVPGVTTIS